MKASKFLAVILAALLPALGCAKEVTYNYFDVLNSPEKGKGLFSTKRIVFEPLENVRYAVKVLDSCNERCELKDMGNCKAPLEDFQLMTICDKAKIPLKKTTEQRNCAYGERLSTFLKKPGEEEPATVSVEIEITFDDEKMHVLKVMGQLKKNLPQEFIDRIVKQEEEKLRQLEEQRDAAHRTAVRSTAEYERAVAERKQATAECEQAEAEYDDACRKHDDACQEYDEACKLVNASKQQVREATDKLIQMLHDLSSSF